MPRPLIIDCDPGVDDCMALFMAAASHEFDIKAVCTVAGNVRAEICTANALGALALAGRGDVPVYQGCVRPLTVEPVFADHIHGESGLGRAVLATAERRAETQHAVDWLIETLREADERVTLAILGPMTNLATALTRAPDIVSGIHELVIMGGADIEGGNITPHAEFNCYADPQAAQIVLDCPLPKTVIGLDTTLQLRCTPARMDRLKAIASPVALAGWDMMEHVNAIYGEVYGAEGAALHDPCVILFLLRPDLFTAAPARLTALTEGDMRGHSSVTLNSPDANGVWTTGIDADAAFDLVLERIARL
ncbi:MAG: nucleoside hydrolase [Maricaulis sp.]|jgi:inosine-uridine nucleoside N-ribohydrolase|nr:nucleoside hydrolase [Maricaulis sp.]HAQ35965.1 nucleoside hydrolase [Alphaproteobacteria bacterium]